jgi:RNA 2',3'-cyclic 3'-phosphodiesterase
VAKERLKSPRARLFVALDLPEPVREGLVAWQEREITDPALRALGGDQIHVTLCFLNYHPEKAIEDILGVVAGVEPRPVELRFMAEPKPIPSPSRPRLFAVEADSPASIEIQQELSDALEARRFYEPEKRAFWPHVTVARVRSERGSRGRGRRYGKPQRVSEPPGALPESLLSPFEAPRVALYRSSLRPTGAEYVRLGELNLSFADEGGRKVT